MGRKKRIADDDGDDIVTTKLLQRKQYKANCALRLGKSFFLCPGFSGEA